jgi:hypothetical protein
MFPISDFEKCLIDIAGKGTIAEPEVSNTILGLRDAQKWIKCVLYQEISKLPADTDVDTNGNSRKRVCCACCFRCGNKVAAVRESTSSIHHSEKIDADNGPVNGASQPLQTDDEVLYNRESSGGTFLRVAGVDEGSTLQNLVNSMNDSENALDDIQTIQNDGWKILSTTQKEHERITAEETAGGGCQFFSCCRSQTCFGNTPLIDVWLWFYAKMYVLSWQVGADNAQSSTQGCVAIHSIRAVVLFWLVVAAQNQVKAMSLEHKSGVNQ